MRYGLIISVILCAASSVAYAQDVQLPPPPVDAAVGRALMFTKEELKQAEAYYSQHQKFVDVPVPNTQNPQTSSQQPSEGIGAGIGTKVAKQLTAPSVMLNSIIDFQSDSSRVWINGKRYKASDSIPFDAMVGEMSIEKIDAHGVALIWTVNSLDIVAKDWKTSLQQLENPIHFGPENTYSADFSNEDETVLLDSSKKKIRIILEPYQSFRTHSLAVKEGKQEAEIVQYEVYENTGQTGIISELQTPQLPDAVKNLIQ